MLKILGYFIVWGLTLLFIIWCCIYVLGLIGAIHNHDKKVKKIDEDYKKFWGEDP